MFFFPRKFLNMIDDHWNCRPTQCMHVVRHMWHTYIGQIMKEKTLISYYTWLCSWSSLRLILTVSNVDCYCRQDHHCICKCELWFSKLYHLNTLSFRHLMKQALHPRRLATVARQPSSSLACTCGFLKEVAFLTGSWHRPNHCWLITCIAKNVIFILMWFYVWCAWYVYVRISNKPELYTWRKYSKYFLFQSAISPEYMCLFGGQFK
jgi:hypothetical protein